jgi:hypothetical protein
MKTSKLIPALIVSFLALGGCDKQPDPAQKDACEQFAKHLAEVVQTEQGEAVPQAQVDKMIEGTVAKCLESPPTDAELKCAMAAQTSEAMKACE